MPRISPWSSGAGVSTCLWSSASSVLLHGPVMLPVPETELFICPTPKLALPLHPFLSSGIRSFLPVARVKDPGDTILLYFCIQWSWGPFRHTTAVKSVPTSLSLQPSFRNVSSSACAGQSRCLSSGCRNKIRTLDGLTDRTLLSVLEAGSPRSGCQRGQVLARTLFLAYRQVLFCCVLT